ncbi:MAG: hypothetical protein M3133_10655, partial [Actinomycetota bacterium]|nr:hypothetical protein [Actinomycetota bacterium]
VADEVLERQHDLLQRARRQLDGEGYRCTYTLRTASDVDAAVVVRVPFAPGAGEPPEEGTVGPGP